MKTRRLAKHKLIDKRSDDAKLRLKKEIGASSDALDFLLEVLEHRADQLNSELLSKSLYESPSYAYKVADLSGGIREVSSLIKLLQETED